MTKKEEGVVQEREGVADEGRPRRRNGRATRELLLAAARRIIVRDGTDHLTIDRVIKEVGLSKGTFLYHFPSRQHLIEALLTDYARHLVDMQNETQAIHGDQQGSIFEGYAEWYWRYLKDDKDAAVFVPLVVAAKDNQHYLHPVKAWYADFFDRLRKESCGMEKAFSSILAFDGLFYLHALGLDESLTQEERRKIVKYLLKQSQSE